MYTILCEHSARAQEQAQPILQSARHSRSYNLPGIADPTICHCQRSFYISDAGEMDGKEVHWAMDEKTEQESFVSDEDDVYRTLNEDTHKW